MKHLKRILYIFAAYIIYDLFFLAIALPYSGRDKIHYIISAVTSFITWSTLYKYLWKCGREDIRTIASRQKNEDGFKGTFKMYYGALIAIPFTIFNTILAISAYNFNITFDVIFKLFNYCCWSFMSDENGNYIYAGVALALTMPAVVCTMGYIVGKTGFSISENILPKIIYKKKSDKKRQ